MKSLSVSATLKTRCGCYQEKEIPFPPQPYILLMLKPRPISPMVEQDLTRSRMETRKFELVLGSEVRAGDKYFAIYEESVP